MNPDDNTMTRITIVKTKDDGKIQRTLNSGRADEKIGSDKNAVPRMQMHGFSGHPPKGSKGIVLTINGSLDMSFILGGEHGDKRPKNLPEGGARQYEDNNNFMETASGNQHFKTQTMTIDCAELRINVTGSVIIDCPDVQLGGPGGTNVLLAGGSEMGHQATRVKAV